MNFKDVEKDLQKLIGMKLNSIRQGAEIEILEIDLEKDNLILKTVAGQKKSRPIEELRKIWSQMMIKPAVHVEGVLQLHVTVDIAGQRLGTRIEDRAVAQLHDLRILRGHIHQRVRRDALGSVRQPFEQVGIAQRAHAYSGMLPMARLPSSAAESRSMMGISE